MTIINIELYDVLEDLFSRYLNSYLTLSVKRDSIDQQSKKTFYYIVSQNINYHPHPTFVAYYQKNRNDVTFFSYSSLISMEEDLKGLFKEILIKDNNGTIKIPTKPFSVLKKEILKASSILEKKLKNK